ncbi:MAG: pentapeptide repeat-containing protein [Anaerolineae bacterium]|nr:pentapeptide repeat-containing protein [Anaerolineae bacterium]
MSDQTMKILEMLEDGKITAAEASDLISKVEELEEKESEPDPQPDPPHRVDFRIPNIGNIPIPPIPQIPDIGKIVADALAEAFGDSSFPTGYGIGADPIASGGRHYAFAAARIEDTDFTDAKLDGNTRLEGADLRFASFVDADLRGANLQGANLSYSDFTDAKFSGANMQGAQLNHGSYTDTDFRNTNLQGADLSMSDFTDASFKDVTQPGLVLRGVTLVGVKYEGVSGNAEPQTTHTGVDVAVDLDEASVTDTAPEQVEANIEEPPTPPEPHRYSEESDLG